MALNGDARTQAIYNAVAAANPALTGNKVTDAERAQVRAQLAAMFGTDTTYLTTNAVILPGTLTTAAGAVVTVTTTTGPASGSVTATSPVSTGTGKLS